MLVFDANELVTGMVVGPDTLVRGDCREVMTYIADASIDLILTDLPFGKTAAYWDQVIPPDTLWPHYERVLKPSGAILLFGTQPFTSLMIMSNLKWFKYCWIWYKSTGTGHLDSMKRPLNYHEDVMVFYQKQPTYNPQKWLGQPNHTRRTAERRQKGIYRGRYDSTESDTSGLKYPRSVVYVPKHTSTEKLHESQKPVSLLEYFILTYTNEGDLVLDSAMGSASTGEACMRTGRHFIGIDKYEAEYEKGVKRLQTLTQTGVQLQYSLAV